MCPKVVSNVAVVWLRWSLCPLFEENKCLGAWGVATENSTDDAIIQRFLLNIMKLITGVFLYKNKLNVKLLCTENKSGLHQKSKGVMCHLIISLMLTCYALV